MNFYHGSENKVISRGRYLYILHWPLYSYLFRIMW